MKKFKFRLERLLSLKEHAETEAKIRFGSVLQKKMSLINENKAMEESLFHNHFENNIVTKDNHLDYDMIELQNYFNQSIQKKIQDNEAQFEQLDEALDELKQDLLIKMKERKIYEELKKKKKKEYKEEYKKHELKITDELASLFQQRKKQNKE